MELLLYRERNAVAGDRTNAVLDFQLYIVHNAYSTTGVVAFRHRTQGHMALRNGPITKRSTQNLFVA
ncbi:hypothetical protein N9Y42_08175, partial [Mariniblastus sp.]|nr:hypothetical protein [Mariniblastus sp.]